MCSVKWNPGIEGKRETKRKKKSICVCEREREREKEKGREKQRDRNIDQHNVTEKETSTQYLSRNIDR